MNKLTWGALRVGLQLMHAGRGCGRGLASFHQPVSAEGLHPNLQHLIQQYVSVGCPTHAISSPWSPFPSVELPAGTPPLPSLMSHLARPHATPGQLERAHTCTPSKQRTHLEPGAHGGSHARLDPCALRPRCPRSRRARVISTRSCHHLGRSRRRRLPVPGRGPTCTRAQHTTLDGGGVGCA